MTKAPKITPAEERISLAIDELAALRDDLHKLANRTKRANQEELNTLSRRIDDTITLLEQGY